MAARKKTEPESPSFEEALAELEALVERIEEDQVPLEQLVADYERGHRLQIRCEELLRAAKERLETITLRATDEIPLDSGSESDDVSAACDSEEPDDDPDDDEIRLF